MIYLASPYSHPDEAVREQRYELACEATATLLKLGLVVFSPIVHGHPLVKYGLATGFAGWEEIDREYISRCDELVVLMIDGWRESEGVRAEVEVAHEFRKCVRYQDMNLWYFKQSPCEQPAANQGAQH